MFSAKQVKNKPLKELRRLRGPTRRDPKGYFGTIIIPWLGGNLIKSAHLRPFQNTVGSPKPQTNVKIHFVYYIINQAKAMSAELLDLNVKVQLALFG